MYRRFGDEDQMCRDKENTPPVELKLFIQSIANADIAVHKVYITISFSMWVFRALHPAKANAVAPSCGTAGTCTTPTALSAAVTCCHCSTRMLWSFSSTSLLCLSIALASLAKFHLVLGKMVLREGSFSYYSKIDPNILLNLRLV